MAERPNHEGGSDTRCEPLHNNPSRTRTCDMARAILLALLLGGCGVATEEQSAPPEAAPVSGKQSKPCRVSASDCGEAVAYSCSEPTETDETGSSITGESHKLADCYPTDATSQSWCCKVR